MKKYFLQPLLGIFNASMIMLLTLLTALSVFIMAPFVWIFPRQVQRITVYWIDGISALFNITLKSKFDIQGPRDLQGNKPYLLISNHRSQLDILILSYAFHRKTPSIRFFMKKELLWTLPFAGLAAWLLGYPFMGRHTSSQIRKNPALKNRDIETTQKACQKFIRYPATIVNYIEGTRFKEQKKLKDSPYQHLLKPKAGGIAIVLKEMGYHLAGLINATIVYQPENVSFWKFCCGNFTKIFCHYEVLPIEDFMLGDYPKDREFRIAFQAWLNTLWHEKDKKIRQLL